MATTVEMDARPDAVFFAAFYAAIGDKDTAFQWVEAACKARHPFTPWVKIQVFQPLHGDRR